MKKINWEKVGVIIQIVLILYVVAFAIYTLMHQKAY